MAMIAITTNSSISVNPECLCLRGTGAVLMGNALKKVKREKQVSLNFNCLQSRVKKKPKNPTSWVCAPILAKVSGVALR
jgi:hypothetical protein